MKYFMSAPDLKIESISAHDEVEFSFQHPEELGEAGTAWPAALSTS
jgi:hypothetical protein